MRKTALIVDDSRSARVVLKRMLETYDLQVDTTESAEAALDYLNHHRPDVIFMDHLMPGMDGFEAVTAIKKNPDTAMIPIMMYTSQEGEVYVGQARALGAVGVLPKTVKPVEVSKVLASLHLADEGASVQPVRERVPAPEPPGEAEIPAAVDGDLRSLLQDLFDQQRVILQRELRDTYTDLAARFANESRPAPPIELAATEPNDQPAEKSSTWLVALLIASVVFAVIVFWQEQQLRTLKQRNVEMSVALQGTDTAPSASGNEQQLTRYQQALVTSNAATIDALEWGINQSAGYDWNEIPLGQRRLELFDELLTRLMSVGFVGEIAVDVHVGDFCMMDNGSGLLELAPDNVPAADCDQIGFDPAESLSPSFRQSVAFANFIVMAEERSGGSIRFALSSPGNTLPVLAYPETTAGITAGDWNHTAAQNNRVSVRLVAE
ncbi:response regulator [Woeseia oceani]|uniref:Response regulatory domain-containing protein n=1 Tax=Woeseia oceani TaxID=1548547 RepID=A0A193LJ27_9GAMM|nr:response regulator [Woeseia oceani]ANO52512.1 hypothetical protein BA177_16150 [Woeseia oceani]